MSDDVGRLTGFEVGCTYTRDEIHARVGGSKRACLPTREGAVVAACLLKSFNPDAPRVVLCGSGARNGPAGALLAAQAGPVPFFTRIDTGRWFYEGRFVVVESLTSGGTFDRLVAHSTRAPDSVSRVVRLAPFDPAHVGRRVLVAATARQGLHKP